MEAYAVKILQQFGLSEQSVNEHEFRPEQIGIISPGQSSVQTVPVLDKPGTLAGMHWFYHLNTDKLRSDLHDLLSKGTVGYSLQLRRNGQMVFQESFGQSKLPIDGGLTGQPWTANTPMHVVSVSKFITAIAMIRLMRDHHIPMNALIWPYLPKYWVRGPGVDTITFGQLLAHTSGFNIGELEPGHTDYAFMQQRVAMAINPSKNYQYLNMNYGLCRILIGTIDAPALFNLFPLFDSARLGDAYWDVMTTAYYKQYVADHIFSPLNIVSSLDHTEPNALAYTFPATIPGWNSGDMSYMAGAAGWHLSVNDLLTIMGAFRRRGTFFDPLTAQQMLDNNIGMDRLDGQFYRDTLIGRIYTKGGFFSTDNATKVEQSNIFFLPNNMELAILSNSPFKLPDGGFRNDVLDTIVNAIEPNLLKVSAVTAVAALGIFGLVRQVSTGKEIK